MPDVVITGKSLSCQICNKSFGRSEHLRRHVLTHTRSREHQCRVCRKSFFRKDALSRHEYTHRTSGPNLLRRGGRACIPCASSKTRCSGDVPCVRCQQRSLQCVHPVASLNQDDSAMDSEDIIQIDRGTPCSTFGMNRWLQIPPPISDDASQPFAGDHLNQAPQSLDQISDHQVSLLPTDQMLFPVPSLSAMHVTTMPYEQPTHIPLAATGHYHDSSRVDLHPFVPINYATVNWLGFEDANEVSGLPDGQWPYPDCLFEFDITGNDSHNFSQISQVPTALRTAEYATNHPPAQLGQVPLTLCGVATGSTISTDEASATPGEFYADGGTARLPRMRKRRAMSIYTTHEHTKESFSLALPSDFSFSAANQKWIEAQGQADLENYFSMLCASSIISFAPFESAVFPTKELLGHLCTLFVDHCSQILPFLHFPTWRLRKQHPLLVLAMAAMGSHYLKDMNATRFVPSMYEFTRRVLFFAAESPGLFGIDSRTYHQVILLYVVGAAYCGDDSLKEHAISLRSKLASLFFISHVDSKDTDQATINPTNHDWCRWVDRECSLRLRYCTWLVDYLLSCQFQVRPCLSLSDAKMPLPAEENMWNAANTSEWSQLAIGKELLPELVVCVDELYMSKLLRAHVGEFARILLIYGLHRRLAEVELYYAQRLSHWTPGTFDRPGGTTLPSLPIWPPALPIFKQWQNLTCDSLDVLHWAANATIGKASGFEHTTVLHLHLARVVLLTPIREIVDLARYLAGERSLKSEAEIMTDRQVVHKWAVQHQYKARLAAIHAGVLFWHVRRFSANAFYEPTAVAHATFVLWAFSAFSSKSASPLDNSRNELVQSTPVPNDIHANHDSSDSESSSDTIILLDRPADDEIVQEFVMNGPRMRANMTGVGDLYGEKGPERVLREGSKILQTLDNWRVRESWAKVLDKLIGVCKRERRKAREVSGRGRVARNVSSTRSEGEN
ncbi:hypothetical protein E4T42_02214 [Aureobasidium subglaciale]|nr:hypothetical protein E4T42_02214 [Aureobasidium subglaciale]